MIRWLNGTLHFWVNGWLFLFCFCFGLGFGFVQYAHRDTRPYVSIRTTCWDAQTEIVQLKNGHILADIACPAKGPVNGTSNTARGHDQGWLYGRCGREPLGTWSASCPSLP